MKNVYKILFVLFLFLAVAQTAMADLPPGQPITFTEIDNLIEQIAQFLIVASVLFAVIMIVWSGITYMAAGADSSKVEAARTRLKNAIIGAAVVLGVGVIIQTIAGLVTREFFGCSFDIFGVCIIR